MTALFFLVAPFLWQTDPPNTLAYLGQKPPGETPQVFAPGIISTKDEFEFGSAFTKDGLQLVYGVGLGNRSEIRITQVVNGKWTKPVPVVTHPTYSFMDPGLSLDGNRLFFITNRPSTGTGPKRETYDIYFLEKQGSGWSDFKSPGPAINTDNQEYYMSFNQNGSMYYSTNFENPDNSDIYVSAWRNQAFQKPTRISSAINTKDYEGDPFIAPDESFLIFCSNRSTGLGNGDLYISFKDENGQWTEAVNMGEKINGPGLDYCPFVSQDGRYFFYASKRDIYWVSASILETYR